MAKYLTFLAFLASPALAGETCNFTLECYMTEPCAGSGWELSIDREGGALSTVFGDLDILHTSNSGQIVAEGDGALYMLTTGEDTSVFTAQTEDGTAISYVGECQAE